MCVIYLASPIKRKPHGAEDLDAAVRWLLERRLGRPAGKVRFY